MADISEIKKAEELLDQSRERLIRGESVSKSGNWELHLDSGIITASQGACWLYGLEGEMWSFELVKDIPLPEYRDLLDRSLSQLVNSGVPYDIEFKIRQKNSGKIIDIHSIAEYNSHERILFGVLQDITDRKMTEHALQKSEENYRSLIENQGEGVAIVDLNETFIFANRAAGKMFGVPDGTLVNQSLPDFVEPGQFAKIKEQSARRIHLEKITYDFEIKTFLGEKRDLLVTTTPQTNSQGKITGTFGIFRDVTAYNLATKALKESEERFRSLFEGSPDAIFLADSETGIILDSNHTACRLTGMSREALIGIHQSQLHPSRYSDISKEIFHEHVFESTQKGGAHLVESYLLNSKGSEIPVEILASSFQLNNRQVIQGVFRDISEQRQTHEKLKTNERNLKNLISNLPGFVYRCRNDKNWTMEYLSEGFAAITGYSVADIIELKNITYNDIIHPDYREYLWEKWQDLLALNFPLEEEYQIVTKSGEIRWVWERGRGIYDDNESLIYLEGFISDITERKRNEQIQKMLYDISTAVLTTHNLEEFIENIREQLCNLLDASNFYVAFYDEITGTFYTPHAVDQKDILSTWRAEKSLTGYLIKQKKALLISEEEFLSLVDRGEIEVIGTPAKLWLGVPLHEEEKIIGAFVVQSYDNPNAYTTKDLEMFEFISHQISLFVQRKRAEGKLKTALAKAEESDRLKSAFLATMNHELRTPLNHILGFSELILSGVMPEDNQSFASSIHASGKNLLSIVEDVFDLALAEQSNVKLRLQTFCLMDQFMENKSSFDQILQSSGKAEQIQLIFKPDKRLLSMYLTVDRSKVNQILVNLFKNAVKFTNSGTIEFGYQSKEPEKLTFFIKDTGIGIPEEKQSVIFDFFRQGDDSPTRIYGGIGIGLAIALKITKILKGELSVVSRADHGSIFYLTVPVELADVNI